VDVDGVFPVAWADDIAGLLPTLIGRKDFLLLIPQAIAQPLLLSSLDTAGLRFITDAPPARGERWRRLRLPHSDSRWTNDENSPDSLLLNAGRRLADSAEEAITLWRTLAVERPSVPLSSDIEFDRHLMLAASTALGTISWTLWREREPATPQLALERFRDLDARVHFSRESVRVRLPLGRRFQDLHEHGLLADVRDAPWLDGRALQFSGG
jgi:hypothetical protein